MKINKSVEEYVLLAITLLTRSIVTGQNGQTDTGFRVNFSPRIFTFNVTWTIENFSALNSLELDSPAIVPEGLQGHKFWLLLFPWGYKPAYKDFLSIYLSWNSTVQEKIKIDYTIWVLNVKYQPIISSKDVRIFNKDSSWGFPMFMRRDILMNPENRILDGDTLRIGAQISFTNSPNYNDYNVRMLENPNPNTCSLAKFFNSNKFSDITIKIKGRTFPAHKVILANNSPFFDRLFEKNGTLLQIKGLSFYGVQQALRFMYEGNLREIKRGARKILRVATAFEMEELKSLAQKALFKRVNKRNAMKMYLMASRLNALELKSYVGNFLQSMDPSVDLEALEKNQRQFKNTFYISF